MTLIERFKAVAEAYKQARGLSTARVSALVFGDGTKLSHILGRDADLTTSRFERSMQWFSDHWPEDVEWPAGIPRPNPTAAEVHAA